MIGGTSAEMDISAFLDGCGQWVCGWAERISDGSNAPVL